MTLAQAYTYLDLLVDKADQPYFTNAEKDKFLTLAKTEWISKNYTKMESDEDSRSALSPLILTNVFEMSSFNIQQQNGMEIQFGVVPLPTGSASVGYWVKKGLIVYYLIPELHIYTLSVEVKYINTRYVTAKSLSNKDYISSSQENDPFATKNDPLGGYKISDLENPTYSVNVNRIEISNATSGTMWMGNAPYENTLLVGAKITAIMNPGLTSLFDNSTGGAGLVWNEFQQTKLVQIAARKMLGNIESSNYEISQKEVENNM